MRNKQQAGCEQRWGREGRRRESSRRLGYKGKGCSPSSRDKSPFRRIPNRERELLAAAQLLLVGILADLHRAPEPALRILDRVRHLAAQVPYCFAHRCDSVTYEIGCIAREFTRLPRFPGD
jgi:hypothetical protein